MDMALVVCSVLAQRAEEVVWEGKLLSEAEMRCFLSVSFSATLFSMCRNSKPSGCSVWGWSEGQFKCVTPISGLMTFLLLLWGNLIIYLISLLSKCEAQISWNCCATYVAIKPRLFCFLWWKRWWWYLCSEPTPLEKNDASCLELCRCLIRQL